MTEHGNTVAKVDAKRLLRTLWRKIWIVLIVAMLSGALVFSATYLFVTPKYKASAMLYVANSSISVGSGFSISSSDLTAAQSLVQTYLVVLNSRGTLDTVIRETGIPYTYEELQRMITAGAVNGTEVFKVTVTSHDPAEAEHIANAIAVVLPGRIASVVDGSSVRVVDYAATPSERSSPSYALNTLVALTVGALLSVLVIVIREMSNNTIRSEEYLTQAYGDVPLLAVIPDAQEKSKGYYRGYYGSYRTRSGRETGGKR